MSSDRLGRNPFQKKKSPAAEPIAAPAQAEAPKKTEAPSPQRGEWAPPELSPLARVLCVDLPAKVYVVALKGALWVSSLNSAER